MMQVIITMAGKGQRFFEAGFSEPKPLVQAGGLPAIQYLIEAFPKDWKLVFVIGDHDRTTDLEDVICNIRSDAEIIYTDYSDRGPVDTVATALPLLNLHEPVLVSYCDYTLLWNAKKFLDAVQGYDAAVVSYQGFHPTYLGPNSYCHLKVEGDQVIELQEKELYTDSLETEITSLGLYYFKSVQFLEAALVSQLRQDLRYNNEFYTSLAIQAMLNEDENLRVLNYPISHLVQFGTPEDIERFDFWYKTLVAKSGLIKPIEILDHTQEKQYWEKIFSSLIKH